MHCRGKSDDAVRRDALGRKVTAVIMAKKKVKDAARDLLGDFLGEHSLELFNIEFVKEDVYKRQAMRGRLREIGSWASRSAANPYISEI